MMCDLVAEEPQDVPPGVPPRDAHFWVIGAIVDQCLQPVSGIGR